jgi:hypothetical protein
MSASHIASASNGCKHENISHATSSNWESVCADCGEVVQEATVTPKAAKSSPKTRLQKVGESGQKYLERARKHCRVAMAKLKQSGEYNHCHESFLVRDALLAVQEIFADLGTFGVGQIDRGNNKRSPAITFLNAGDTYELTILYINGRFRVGTWGDVVERGNYN